MIAIVTNAEKSKTNDPHKFVLKLSQRLDLRSSNEHVLQNLSVYYAWKNIRQQYKSDKLKIVAPTWNDEFKLSHGSYSVSYWVHKKKNMKHPLILLFLFTSIGLIID